MAIKSKTYKRRKKHVIYAKIVSGHIYYLNNKTGKYMKPSKKARK